MGDRGKSRKNSVTSLIPSHFMILYLNRYHMTETSVFKYTHCLCHDTAFQCVLVVPYQALHRWLVVSSFHLCRFMSLSFSREILKYINSVDNGCYTFQFLTSYLSR